MVKAFGEADYNEKVKAIGRAKRALSIDDQIEIDSAKSQLTAAIPNFGDQSADVLLATIGAWMIENDYHGR